MKTLRPLKAIRATCMECAGTAKAVAYCTCDGLNSTKCQLWPYRFGIRPETTARGVRRGDGHTRVDAGVRC